MSMPKVTVLMPVYNGERYLRDAIASILGQTFTDFELLLIDDGSTDKSCEIISSFTDARIRLVKNDGNIGLIRTLNKGIDLAAGEYIARMDCDDISLPQRFEKQVSFLDKHPETIMVASYIVQLNADGDETGSWADDIDTKTSAEIHEMIPRANCIAHPSIMMRKAIAQNYRYNEKQKGSEDWDLWLRISQDGLKIEKINEVLLKYRVHPQSATNAGNSGMRSQKKIIKVKRTFLFSSLLRFKINSFFFLVFYSWIRSVARYIKVYSLPLFLRSTKRILTTNPFRVFSDHSKLKEYLSSNTHNLFLFFPYTIIGGAERVHADIAACLADQKPLVFFTGFSKNNAFLSLYENNAKVFNIPHVLNYPLTGKKAMALLADYINKQKDSKTLGSNSIFYDELLGFLSPNVFCTDLKHSFIYPGNQEEYTSIPKILRLNKRIFIGKNAIEKARRFYFDNNIPKEYAGRIIHIGNYINVPAAYPQKIQNEKLKVIYTGRATPEKRVHIVARVAEECKKQNIAAIFQIVGDMGTVINKTQYPFIEFTGEVIDKEVLKNIYLSADILLITSDTEGFPMSIMEALAFGVVPVSTPVGDVPLHIINNETGFVTSTIDGEKVIFEMTGFIKMLTENRQLIQSISVKGFEYAGKNFQYANFYNSYRKLFGF